MAPFLLIILTMYENKRLVPACIIYRDGTRGNTNEGYTALRYMKYDPNVVVRRSEQAFPFFRHDADKGKFAVIPGQITYNIGNRRDLTMDFTISFYRFLAEFYNNRDMTVTNYSWG
jgi:hypothetical protein